jgi:prepilin peptidase CpaA
MLLGLLLHGASHGVAGLFGSVIGMVVCAVAPGFVYKASDGRGIGGGDLKLFAALGALLGPTQGLEAELSSFVVLGVYALFRFAFQGKLLRTLVGSVRVLVGLVVPSLRNKTPTESALMCEMRMGPAIAAGVATVLSVPSVARWLPWLV